MSAYDRAKARFEALQKLANAHRLLSEAAALADEGRFDLEFMGLIYVPKSPADGECESEGWPELISGEEVVPGEWWMPSSC